MAKRRKKTKRTLTPEQLEKMKAGREAKKRHAERMEGINDLETRLRNGARNR